MNEIASIDTYGTLIEPATVRIQRLLPGSIERVWDYLTVSDLRRRWLASGEMVLEVGAPFTLTWRNDEISDPAGERPDGMGGEHSMASRITEVDPPRRLSYTWDGGAEVTLELEPQGRDTLLTVTHRRLPNRANVCGVSAGWHAHLDVLDAVLSDTRPAPFWDAWRRLRAEYERRIPN